jgi:hypothetical protein
VNERLKKIGKTILEGALQGFGLIVGIVVAIFLLKSCA